MPEKVNFLVKSDVLNRLRPKMYEAAQKIRRAILDGRTILLRHHNDMDGIVSGVAMEKAIVPLIQKAVRYKSHYIRFPLYEKSMEVLYLNDVPVRHRGSA